MILAIDSSGTVASVALLDQDTDILVAEYTINNKMTHSQTLLPMIKEIMDRSGTGLDEIDAIAIAEGPGSFTGLRIGASTAKGLGLVLKKPLVPVPTLEGLAFQFFGTDRLVCPVMDARRNQVYTGIYEFQAAGTGNLMKDKDFSVVRQQSAMDIHDLIAQLNDLGREVIFLGDGVPVYGETISKELEAGYMFAPAMSSRQRAGAVAALGAYYFSRGRVQTAAQHVPEYLRASQAERERAGQ